MENTEITTSFEAFNGVTAAFEQVSKAPNLVEAWFLAWTSMD